ncbi:MAG: DUF6941 family protein [Planctomycetota bacterium]|jgi:hypothetical protein
MTTPRTPKVNALVVSLDKRRDEKTGRLDLIGVVGTLHVPTLPVQLPGVTVFVSLTNLQGEYRLALEFIDLEQDQLLVGVVQEEQFTVPEPLSVWSEVAELPGPIVIEHPGRYACRLLLNQELLHEIVLEIVA